MKTNRFFLLLSCLATLAACTPEEIPSVEPTQKVFFGQYAGGSLDGSTSALVDVETGNTSVQLVTKTTFTLQSPAKCSIDDGQIDVTGTNLPYKYKIEQYASVCEGDRMVWYGKTGEAFTLPAGSYTVRLTTFAWITAGERFIANLTLSVENNRGVSFE